MTLRTTASYLKYLYFSPF